MNLIGIMISVGLAGLLAMMLADLNTIMSRNNMTARAESDMVSYVNQLRANIQPSTSTESLKGNPLAGPIVIHDPLDASVILGAINYKDQPNDPWSVKSIRFDNVLPVPAVPDFYRMTLKVVIAADTKRIMSTPIRTKVIGDVYCLAPNRIIEKCYGVLDPFTTAKTQCEALQGTWNGAKAECAPKSGSDREPSNDRDDNEPKKPCEH